MSVQSDDVQEECNTLRVWVIAIFALTIAVGANAYWALRFPSPTLTAPLMVLFAWPTGRAWARYMPHYRIPLPGFCGSEYLEVNPGEWTMKEHGLIAQMSMVSANQNFNYSLFVIPAISNKFLWARPIRGGTFSLGVLLGWSSAFFGIGLAGLGQNFLVRAASTIWPYNLTLSLLINVLHAEEEPVNGWTRLRFFKFIMLGVSCWQVVPTYLFTGLSYFNWICWIAPKSVVVNYMFGYGNGLALLPMSFDWAQFSAIASPMVPPWWTMLNLGVAYLVFWLFLGSVLIFSNADKFGYFPMLGSGVYDKFGKVYDATRVLDAPHGHFKQELYDNYSDVYVSYGYFLAYFAGLAMPMALLVHFALHSYRAVINVVQIGRTERDDIHARMMARYKQVPTWLYLAFLPLGFGIGIGAVRGLETGMPIYTLVIAFALSLIFFLPAGLIYAHTNLFMTFTNVISELLTGYMAPGSATTCILFKGFTIGSNNLALLFASGLKMGHYLKVPPRVSFVAQTFFMLWGVVVQYAVYAFLEWKVSDLCSSSQADALLCLGGQQAFSSSVVWGLIGPQRVFGRGDKHYSLYWSMLGGALLPIPLWLLGKIRPQVEYVSAPVLLLAATFIPSSAPLNSVLFIVLNFGMQWLVRHLAFGWFDRYAYILSASLDAGTAVTSLAVFFALRLPKDGHIDLKWWGNEVYSRTRDYSDTPWLQPPPNGLSPS